MNFCDALMAQEKTRAAMHSAAGSEPNLWALLRQASETTERDS